MRGSPARIKRTERIGVRDSSSRVTRYSSGEAPRQGDIVFPTGDTSGLIRCYYLVLGVSRYGWTSTTVNVRPILEQNTDRERGERVDPCVGRFKLVKRGGAIVKEFWALRLPDGDLVAAICGHLQTFDSQQEAVEYAEGQPGLDYAIAVKFVQVAR